MEHHRDAFALILANHWSFTGIGWQLGLESCVWSIQDSLNLADREPYIKVSINLDARAYSEVNAYFPEVAAKLRKYLKQGKVDIIGGSYGQPVGSMIGGESVIRQILHGKKAIRDSLDFDLISFLEEEEFSFAQLPQILKKSGFVYASLAQCDTWGKSGSPVSEDAVFLWHSPDGTDIPCMARTALYFHPPAVTKDVNMLMEADGLAKIRAAAERDELPPVTVWTEFGWEPLGGQAFNRFTIENYIRLSEKYRVVYTTIAEYMSAYPGQMRQKQIHYDEFNKLLPWGIGADQLRRYDREIEARLLAAEKLDVWAFLLGRADASFDIDRAWKNLLISQSHDVSLCEYTRWGGGVIPPEDMVVNTYGLQWGALGYHHLHQAMQASSRLMENAALRILDVADKGNGRGRIAVFNMSEKAVREKVRSGRIYMNDTEQPVRMISVRDSAGNRIPHQVYHSSKCDDGSLFYADIGFYADVPSFSYSIYSLELHAESVDQSADRVPLRSWLTDHGEQYTLENIHLKIDVSKKSGLITSLVDKETDLEYATSEFPVFTGQPSHEYPHWAAKANLPYYDTRLADTDVEIVDSGPVSCRLKSTWKLPQLVFEISYTLDAEGRDLQLDCRLKVHVPPKSAWGDENGWQLGLDIPDGYWLEFPLPADRRSYLLDTPFMIEASERDAIHARSFLDITGDAGGLMIVHGGNQYFKTDGNVIKNLLMREWESHFTKQYGWPVYSEFSYRLRPHNRTFTNLDRIHTVYAKDNPPYVLALQNGSGKEATQDRLMQFESDSAYLSSMARTDSGIEVRIVEVCGLQTQVKLESALFTERAMKTDFTRKPDATDMIVKTDHPGITGAHLSPWEIATYVMKSTVLSN